MPSREAVPGDPIEWHNAYQYANELVADGILTKEEIIYGISMFAQNEPEQAYEWLINEASIRHLGKFPDDVDDISVSLFLEKSNKSTSINDELSSFLENTYTESRNERVGGKFLRLLGIVMIVAPSLHMAMRYDSDGESGNTDFTTSLIGSSIMIAGAYIIRKSTEQE